jgi:hypothetical protein
MIGHSAGIEPLANGRMGVGREKQLRLHLALLNLHAQTLASMRLQ